ncbi:MAG: glycosyltransferase [Kiritimatiellia bacterium]
MKVIHISCFDWMGGAGKAANRLHNELRKKGVDSHMLVDVKERRDDPTIHSLTGLTGLPSRIYYHLRSKVDQRALSQYPSRKKTPWVVGKLNRKIATKIERYAPDLVHVHWTSATASLKELVELPYPVLWTMHDIGLATGGCCYPGSCERYKIGCGRCPQLGSEDANDLSSQSFKARRKVFANSGPTFVVLSEWQQNTVSQSPILEGCKFVKIANGVNIDNFKPMDKAAARSALALPHMRTIIGFGAESVTNPLKGGAVLGEALKILCARLPEANRPVLAVFGAAGELHNFHTEMEVFNLGYLTQDRLAQFYSAMDLMVVPSLEDNCPQVPQEAQSCGCPVVGFANTGVAELILDGVTGRVVKFNDPEALAEGIGSVLKTRQKSPAEIRALTVNRFSINNVVDKYIEVYKQLIANDLNG